MPVRRIAAAERDPNEDSRMTSTGWQQTPVVYVIQEDSGKNMTSALDHGSMECLLQQREEATMLNIPTLVDKLRYGLRNFTPRDFLLLSGSPASIGLACAIASDMTGGRFNILKWDQQERRYWKAVVNLKQGR